MSLFAGKPEDTEADLSAFVAHIRWIRKILPAVALTVTQFLHDGAQLAERHTSSTTLPDCTGKRAETFQFAEVVEDGRSASIIETVKQLG